LKDPSSVIDIQNGETIELPDFVFKQHIPHTKYFSMVTFISRATRREAKAFTCDYPSCDKYFYKWHNLLDHLRVHTREKPFECPFDGCKLKFNQVQNRKTHLNQHKKNGYVKCRVCR